MPLFYERLYRKGGLEKQYKYHCPRCTLTVGYQTSTPPAKNAAYFYILHGALTQEQGNVPSDAFDLGVQEDSS